MGNRAPRTTSGKETQLPNALAAATSCLVPAGAPGGGGGSRAAAAAGAPAAAASAAAAAGADSAGVRAACHGALWNRKAGRMRARAREERMLPSTTRPASFLLLLLLLLLLLFLGGGDGFFERNK